MSLAIHFNPSASFLLRVLEFYNVCTRSLFAEMIPLLGNVIKIHTHTLHTQS